MNRTILLVDDDEVLWQVLGRVLERLRYRVCRAATAAQAVRLAREERPGLALLDLCLPDQDGVVLARQLRADQPELVLLLMTAYPVRLQEHPELQGEFARVLAKPLDLAELKEALAASLNLCASHDR